MFILASSLIFRLLLPSLRTLTILTHPFTLNKVFNKSHLIGNSFEFSPFSRIYFNVTWIGPRKESWQKQRKSIDPSEDSLETQILTQARLYNVVNGQLQKLFQPLVQGALSQK